MWDDFLVAGGGIAGLASALSLAKAGRSIRLYEQAAAFEEVGAGLQMSPNGVRALQALGAWEAVAPTCVVPTEIHVRDGQSGRILQRIRLGKDFETAFGAPYRVCHRADLLAGLVSTASAMPNVELNTGSRFRAATSAPESAELDLGGVRVKGAAVICADGIRSALRNHVCGAVTPMRRGHAIYRALLPIAGIPAEVAPDCVTIWLHPGAHVVHYPVSNWQHFNIVVAIESTLAETGWRQASDGKDLQDAFVEADETLQGLLSAPASWIKWPGADLPELPRWHAGRLLLIGDSAHATLPYLAQGAVMALEDAVVLGREVGRGDSLDDAFARYVAERRPRAARIQAESRRLGRIYHAGGAMALARNASLALLGPNATLKRNRWIYEWKP